ncbi:hypothetical protein GCM10027037_27360 [Mucilaginibacter koreensis]
MGIQEQVTQAALQELETQSWGATEQYLQIYEVVKAEGKPVIARIDMEEPKGLAIVYFSMVGERLYLAIGVDTQPEVAIRYINTESYNKVYLRASSETLTAAQIQVLSTLQASESFNKGELRKSGKVTYTYSCANYEPNPEPDAFEDKLMKLLDYLEQDNAGVAALVMQADAYIQVDQDIHYGNGLIGGPYLSKEVIRRMSGLNLGIEFSQYATGKPFV